MIKLSYLFEQSLSKEDTLLQHLGTLLRGTKFENKVYLAGGAVRDEIMGKPVKDIDVVVAMPDGGIEFANWITKRTGAYKDGANPVIFPRFGTAKFNLRGLNLGGVDLSDIDIESVMTRGEKYEPGSRKPTVAYSDLKADVERRDLTVNSLLKNLSTGKIEDLTGHGIEDIKNGVVRTPLDPNITFKDDPLRMLRAIRFTVKYDWKMVPELLEAIKENAPLLNTLSKERIQDEFSKILMTDKPDLGLKILTATGLNKYIIPELDAALGVTQNKYHKNDVYDHILEVVKNSPKDLKTRLAALFHDIGKPKTKSENETGVHFYDHENVGAEMARDIMRRLKFSNDIVDSVSKMVKMHMVLKQAGPDGNKASDKVLRKLAIAAGDDLQRLLGLMQSDNISHEEKAVMPNQIPNIAKRLESLATPSKDKPTLPISGHDILKQLNIKPGPMIKDLLAAVENAWYENPKISKEDAMNIVKSAYNQLNAARPTGNLEQLLKKKIRNPETENDILVRTALGYDKTHSAHIAAKRYIKANLK